MRILSIPASSVLAGLGLRASDVLRSVNGFEVVDPEKMLEAYAKLKSAPHLELALVRGGQPVQIEIDIR
jgi:general secretion pathway protein C